MLEQTLVGVGAHMSRWPFNPTLLALEASAWRHRKQTPTPFCSEVGRRILLAQLEWSQWVLRRVEKARFEQDRSVVRQISIELSVRADAPVFVDRHGEEHWLVPLSLMRRRTLVNLDLRTEDQQSITMLGLRLAQQLDQSMLRAAAEIAGLREPPPQDEVDRFIVDLVAGERKAVAKSWAQFEEAQTGAPSTLGPLLRHPVFATIASDLRRNFTLYAMLPVQLREHRLLRMTFAEPTEWSYQQPTIRRADGVALYLPGGEVPRRARIRTALGLQPTRVRFQVPGAENAASYHFEIEAPEGMRVVRASLLAGRPNYDDPRVSSDHWAGHVPTLGLHAVEVPNGSLCRAQVDLRVPTRGWLTHLLVSCWLVVFVLLSVDFHLVRGGPEWSKEQVTNVVLLLITVAGGAATYIVQRDAGAVAARMVAKLRALGTIALALPAIQAGFLVYERNGVGGPNEIERGDKVVSTTLLVVALFIASLILRVWWQTLKDERPSARRRSPWDQTVDMSEEEDRDWPPGEALFTSNNADGGGPGAIRRHGFDSPAVGVASAEGWHERYAWTDDLEQVAVAALQNSVRPPGLAGDEAPASSCLGCAQQCARSRPSRTSRTTADATGD